MPVMSYDSPSARLLRTVTSRSVLAWTPEDGWIDPPAARPASRLDRLRQSDPLLVEAFEDLCSDGL